AHRAIGSSDRLRHRARKSRRRYRPVARTAAMNAEVLRRWRCVRTTLNPRFRWECVGAFGLSARGGLALPACTASPRSLLRDKANVAYAVVHSRGLGTKYTGVRAGYQYRGVW